MRKGQKVRPVVDVVILLACAVGMAACQLELSKTEGQPPEAQGAAAAQQSESGLVIENDSELPDTYPHGSYELRFRAHGGVSVLHWRLQKGSLPPGMKLEDDGLLHGQAERSGEFQFTVSVTDARPQQGVQKGFVLRVRSALTLNWKAPARVNGNRIEGSVEVSNTTPDDMDLTFIALAVAARHRCERIALWRNFALWGIRGARRCGRRSGAQDGDLPGAHADAVGAAGDRGAVAYEAAS